MSQAQLPVDLRPRCGEWIGAVLSLPSYVSGDGPPYRPSAVIWFEPESGLIVGMQLVKPDEALGRAADLFHRATDSPMMGEPRTPRSLRVATSELAQALDGRVGDVDLVVAPTPEVDRMAATLFERMAASDEEDESELTYIGPDMTEADVARFFGASARLHREAPWDAIPPDGFLSVTCSRLGIEAGALCVVGQAGEAFGFALFRSAADAIAYVDACEQQMTGEDAAFPPHIMFSYDDRPTIGRVLASEIAKHGWEIAGKQGYPSVVVLDGDLVSRGLTREELDGVTAIAHALAGFTADGRLSDLWNGGQTETWKHAQDGVDVILGAPLWLLDDEEDPGVVRQRSFEVLGRFADTPGAAEHLGWLELLVSYCVDYMGAGLDDVSPAELHKLVFEIVPRKVSCEPGDAPAVVAALRAFLAFASRDLDSATACKNLESLPTDASQQLARRLADPRTFGMAKSFVMGARREGFEPSDAGLAAYLKTRNGRIPLASSVARVEARKQPDKAKRAKRKTQGKARKNSRKR